MSAISASEARKSLFPLIERINDDHTHVEITSKHGNAVLMSLDEYEALQETAYLLRAPANARRLIESLAQAATGDTTTRDLVEQ
jgi:antitoxin YefM